MTKRLADLREPPVVGRFYLVPVIRDYPWNGRRGTWPVLGPLHEDAEFFKFGAAHYHVDARFISNRAAKWAAGHIPGRYASKDVERDLALAATAIPLCSRGSDLPKGRPELAVRRCYRSDVRTPFRGIAVDQMAAMAKRYGDPAPAIRLADGRLLCPHRKVDLSQFPADADGVVVCPLHGLRVCVRDRAA